MASNVSNSRRIIWNPASNVTSGCAASSASSSPAWLLRNRTPAASNVPVPGWLFGGEVAVHQAAGCLVVHDRGLLRFGDYNRAVVESDFATQSRRAVLRLRNPQDWRIRKTAGMNRYLLREFN